MLSSLRPLIIGEPNSDPQPLRILELVHESTSRIFHLTDDSAIPLNPITPWKDINATAT